MSTFLLFRSNFYSCTPSCSYSQLIDNVCSKALTASAIHLPIEINSKPDEPRFHEELPVFSINSKACDAQSALLNSMRCPVQFISRAPPQMVTENMCFVVDGDIVRLDEVLSGSGNWINTASSTRFYCSDSLKTFYQVSVNKGGEIKSAYRRRRRSCGMEAVSLEKVFRVARYFSYWKSCKQYHRIVSLISPVVKDVEAVIGFKQRIFIQYLWRTDKKSEKQQVLSEYAEIRSRRSSRSPSIRPSSAF